MDMNDPKVKIQLAKMEELRKQGYVWDKQWSISAAGVILKKSKDEFYFFGLNGEIMHNPQPFLTVKL